MMMVLYVFWFVCVFTVVVYSIRHPANLNNKKYVLALIFSFLFIFLGWSRGAYDVEIGISRYVNYLQMESFTEIGYNSLVRFFHMLGFEYREFFVFCSFVEITSIFWFTNKNCQKSQISLCLFLIYPLAIYLQYIRTLAAIPFVLIALDALINKEKHYVLKFVLFCLIASTFHFSAIFFLLYLPASFLSKKMVVISTLVGAVILQMVGSITFLYNIVNRYLGSEKVGILERSINAEGTFGRIFGVVASILFFYSIFYYIRLACKVDTTQERDDLYWKINFISVICVPLTLSFGVGFARIPTLVFVFNYPYLVEKISEIRGQKKRLIVYVIIVLYLSALLYINYRNIAYRERVLIPFFEQNELIEWILQ